MSGNCGMDTREKIEILSARITPERYAKMLRALEFRTRRLTVVLEDVFQSHNAAAVLRSCDAFGLQDAHIIENLYKLKISDNVDMGVSKWQTLHFYSLSTATYQRSGMPKPKCAGEAELENSRRAFAELKSRGYFLAASSPRAGTASLCDIPADRPLALLIGTELTGLTQAACDAADFVFSLPMLGFAQSFNLSVFAAICLSELSSRMRAAGDEWKMSAEEKDSLLLEWLRKSVSNADSLIGGAA